MATPFVTGVLAALISSFPDKDYAGLIAAVLTTVDPIASLTDKTVSGGRINAALAFESLAPPTSPSLELQISSDRSTSLLTLNTSAAANTACTIEESNDLTVWTSIFTGPTDGAGALSVEVSPLAGQRRFYRARVQE